MAFPYPATLGDAVIDGVVWTCLEVYPSGYGRWQRKAVTPGGGGSGADGLSAYQIAVANGFVGSEVAWLSSLQGADGEDGEDGGTPADGKSAYQVAVDNGFVGDEAAWLASLHGAPGSGDSAYDIAVANGFVGDEAAWLASLKGSDASGDSAYDIAVAHGFVGDEAAWLASLKGDPGDSGGTLGTYQLEAGTGAQPELAPAVGAYTTYSTGVTAGTDYLDFTEVAALGAAIKTSAGLKDNTAYDLIVEVFSYVKGALEVLLYGPTTGHLGISSKYAANGTYSFPLTTNGSTGTQINQIRVRANPASGTSTFRVRVSIKEQAAGAPVFPVRAFDIVHRERRISICDAGVRPENSAALNYTNWTTLVATRGRRCWYVPSCYGEYDITALPIYWDADIEGEGRRYSIFNITGTGAIHGCDVRGPATFDRGNHIILAGMALKKTGGAQTAAGTGPGAGNWSGLYCRTKLDTYDLTIEGFTNDGFYFAPFDANEATGAGGTIDRAPFFSKHFGLIVRGCGRDGLVVRRGANAHLFSQSQFIACGRYGLNHFTDGFATYSNEFQEGQTSYCGNIGWNFQNGTNLVTSNIYAEQNGCLVPGDNTNAYANTLLDYYFGDNCTDSDFVTGAIFGNNESTKLSHIRLPAFNPTRIKVREGGRLRYGTW